LNTIVRVVGAFFIGLSVFLSPISTEASEAQEEPYIIGMDQSMAPFTFLDDDGEPAGLEIEMFETIAEEQGFEYEFQNFSFSAGIQALETGQIDGLLAGVAVTPEREEVFDFSENILEVGNTFAVNADSPYETVDDLRGETISVKTGSTGLDIVQEMQDEYDFDILTFDQSVNMHQAVMNGDAAASVESSAVQAFAISTGQVDFRQVGDVINPVNQALATNAGPDGELLTMFDEGLAQLKEDGRYDAILDTYFGETADADSTGVSTTPQAIANSLLTGLWRTIWVAFVSIIIATILGLIFGLMRVSNSAILKLIADIYIYAMRGVPMIVFSFFVFFGVSDWIGTNFEPIVAGIAALSINTGAYIAEIIRGGIQGVPRGQAEAARSLGMPSGLAMRKIILPQALKHALPSLVNQFILTLKNTSILSVIGVVELTMAGQIIISRTYQSGNIWLIVGATYIILITVLTLISERIEANMDITTE
jgi:polar amino acid transport system substrate-binding protein